jgi:cytochrome c biogenesis factor
MSTSLVEALRDEIIIPDAVNITLQINPMIYLLWIGIVVMLFGIVTQFLLENKFFNIGEK